MNRSTILRAIKSGRISATKDELGAWVLEPVEVHRLYPPVAVRDANEDATPKDATTDALVAELRAQLTEMRSQRDAWQRMAEARLLAPPERAHPKQTLWQWLRSTG